MRRGETASIPEARTSTAEESYDVDAETNGGPETSIRGVDVERSGVFGEESESGDHDGRRIPSDFRDPTRGRRRPWGVGVVPDDDP